MISWFIDFLTFLKQKLSNINLFQAIKCQDLLSLWGWYIEYYILRRLGCLAMTNL